MMKQLITLLFLTLGAVESGYAQGFVITGQMHHSNLEGGCWYFQDDRGKKYELWGDSAMLSGLHSDGVHASLRVERAKGAASICMMGDIVRVLQRIDTKREAHDPVFTQADLRGTVHRTKLGTWYLESLDHKQRWEFGEAPAKKYRNPKAIFHQRVSVLNDASKTKENMSGVIFLPKLMKKDSLPRPQRKDDSR